MGLQFLAEAPGVDRHVFRLYHLNKGFTEDTGDTGTAAGTGVNMV